jgi:hypothetical protein
MLDDAVGFHKRNCVKLRAHNSFSLRSLGRSDGPADSGLRMCKPVLREVSTEVR